MSIEVNSLPPANTAAGAVVDLTDAAKAEIAQLVRRAAAEHKAGKLEAVRKTLEAILEIDPQHAEALFNLAILARDRKEIMVSENLFKRAIRADPLRIDAYHGLGELLLNARHLMLAISVFRQGLKIAPTRVPLLSSLARCYLQLRQAKLVAELCPQILDIFPDDPEALWLLAWAQYMLKDYQTALLTLDRLERLAPDNLRGMALRHLCYGKLGETDPADTLWRDLIDKTNGNLAFFKTVLEVYVWCDRADQSYEMVKQYLAHDPDSSLALRELCALQMNDGLFVEVQDNLEAVLRSQPDSLYVQMVKGLGAFRFGDYQTFLELHDTRWGRDTHEGKWQLPIPLWDGKSIGDRELLVYSEQGVGDHVMYANFFAELRQFAKRITIETSVRLFGLFQRSFPDMTFVDRNQVPPKWPYHDIGAIAPYGDLAGLLHADFENLPHRDGYLVPDPELAHRLRRRYQEKFPGKRLIGISWRSGNRDSAVTRSVDLQHWKEIFDVPGNAFISLQYGAIEDDIANLKEALGVEIYRDPEIDPMSIMDPFASQVAAMDLVISADNSTVHFAGALGVPCWLMLAVNSDWRWQLERTESIWYKSLALFRSRREQGGDWGPVITEIAAKLAAVTDAELSDARAQTVLRCMHTMDRHGRISEAEEFARRLVEMGSHVGEAMRIIGIAALKIGAAADAVDILSRAASLRPDDTKILGDLLVALDANGQEQQAERLGRDALRQAEADIHLLGAMGKLLTRQRRYDEATDYVARILRHQPENVEARQSLARFQILEGELELGCVNLEKALSYDPNARTAHLELAEIMLRSPEPPAMAWQHFSWRFPERPGEMPRHLAMVDPDLRPNVWTEGKLRRQRLMLRAEYTLYEQLLFMGRFTEIVANARPILMEVDSRLLPILDLHVRKMDIRAAGGTNPETIVADRIQVIASLGDLASQVAGTLRPEQSPRAIPSLASDPESVARYRQAFQAALPGRKLVGLSWREPRAPAGLVLLLEQIMPLLLQQNLGVVLLQSDLQGAEIAVLSQIAGLDLPAARHFGGTPDIVEMAAQLAALDAVVSAEELTAHLAAASGVKTIKLCGRLSHWAWGDRSGPCLWYPDAQSIHLSSVDDVAALPDQIVAQVAGAIGVGQRG